MYIMAQTSRQAAMILTICTQEELSDGLPNHTASRYLHVSIPEIYRITVMKASEFLLPNLRIAYIIPM